MTVLTLAHYYTTPEVQQLADYVGDSLDLAIHAQEDGADRIIFLGVKFMAETAKILNPTADVILPDAGSTCSLVEQTDIKKLTEWVNHHKTKNNNVVHVAYINSSAAHKALADIIVTSRIVDNVISDIYRQGKSVIFSPDYNMGNYLNYQYGYGMPVWSAVCDVHDKFKIDELKKAMNVWTNGPKFVIAHPESPLPILQRADYIGSTHGMLDWITNHEHKVSTIFVATEEGLLYNMRELRPDLDIRQAPTYSGCQCNQCDFMKMNTVDSVQDAINGNGGLLIEYLTDEEITAAKLPIDRMMEFQKTGKYSD